MSTLLEKYRQGRITAEELDLLSKEMEQISDNELGALLEQEWSEFSSPYPLTKSKKDALYPIIRTEQKPSRIHVYMGIAASVLMFICVGLGLYVADIHKEMKLMSSSEVRFESGNEGTSVVSLPDGSTVKLNARSYLSYGSDFGVSDRVVKIEGEAFFDVAKDSEKQFVVKAQGMEVIVHGTKFYVYAYPDSVFSEMSLVEGSVSLRSGDSILKVSPNEKVCIDRCTGRMNLMMTDNEVETAWLKKTMVFMHEPLYRVIDKLERRFGVQIECTDGISLSDIYTGTFKDRNITDILDVLKMHYGFDYQIDDNQIKITHNN